MGIKTWLHLVFDFQSQMIFSHKTDIFFLFFEENTTTKRRIFLILVIHDES